MHKNSWPGTRELIKMPSSQITGSDSSSSHEKGHDGKHPKHHIVDCSRDRVSACETAISQTHSPRVDNWLIPRALALCDNVGSFCREKKTSERAAAGPAAGRIEGSAGHPHRGRGGFQLWRGFNWNPAEE